MKPWAVVLLVLALAAGAVLLVFAVRRAFAYFVDRRISGYQNDLLQKQAAEVENMYRQTRGWRHDLQNHIATMQAYLNAGDLDALGAYLKSLGRDLKDVDHIVKTGSVMADAILNSKLSLARAQGVEVHATASIPPSCEIPDMELCVMIGNLLDNAVEACARQKEGAHRFLRVYIGKLKSQLYICVTNSTGDLQKEGNRFLSAKPGRDRASRFGFGLMRIDKMAARCSGYVNRQSEPGVFATELFLPLSPPKK